MRNGIDHRPFFSRNNTAISFKGSKFYNKIPVSSAPLPSTPCSIIFFQTINNFGKLEKERMDALIFDEMEAKEFTEQKGHQNIVPLQTPIFQNKAFIAFGP